MQSLAGRDTATVTDCHINQSKFHGNVHVTQEFLSLHVSFRFSFQVMDINAKEHMSDLHRLGNFYSRSFFAAARIAFAYQQPE